LIILIGRCAAGTHEVHVRLDEAGVTNQVATIEELKKMLVDPPKHTDIFIVWVKAPLQLRIERFLRKEGDSYESRSKLVDRLISDGQDFHARLGAQLSDYVQTKLIRYWMTIDNPEDNPFRLDFIVDYIKNMLTDFD